MGALIGGLLWTYFFGMIAGRVFWRDEEPDMKAAKASFVGAAITVATAGFGYSNPIVGLVYIPGAVAAYFILRRGYRKAWAPDSDADTFE